TLIFNRSDDISFAGSISGNGNLTKQGAGVLTLTGTNSYSGITLISHGTLRAGSTSALSAQSSVTIGSGTTLDLASYDSTVAALSGAGTVTLGSATLTLSTGGLYTGVISGTGGVALNGGTLTLTGTNTYTGATTITSGATLRIGDGNASGSVAGNIVDNGALVFNRSDTLSYTDVISGAGGLTVNGGMLILNGVNTYTGTTTVNAGTLQIGDENHSSASIASSVTVESGATLSGHGTIYGSVTADDGATVKPGGSIGTLSVTGDLTMSSGSKLEVEVSGDQYSTVSVAGTATIGGTLLIDADSSLPSDTSLTLVSASSVSGSFSSVEVSGLDSDAVYSLTSTGTSISLTSSTAATSVTGLYSDLVTTNFATLHTLNATLLEHPLQTETGLSVWATSFGHAGTQQHTGDSQDFSSRGAGIIGGVNVRQENGFHYGLAVAYDQTALSVHSSGGTALANTAYFAADAGTPLAYGQIDGGVFYFFSTTGVHRNAMVSNPDSHGFGAMAQYSIHIDDVMPYARISYIRQYRGSTTETGGSNNLAVAERNYNSLRGDIGARYSHDFDLGNAVRLTPEAGVGLSTELASSSRKSVVQLSSDTSSWITPDYAKPDNFAYTARAGMTLKLDQDMTFSIYTSGRKGKHGEEGMLGLNGSFRF
ncbi:MAG: autotransporter domain-containing protein, partial [Rhizomicrobium sp.]